MLKPPSWCLHPSVDEVDDDPNKTDNLGVLRTVHPRPPALKVEAHYDFRRVLVASARRFWE